MSAAEYLDKAEQTVRKLFAASENNANALRWLVAYTAAEEMYENDTVKDVANMLMDGVRPYQEYDIDDLIDALFGVIKSDMDDELEEGENPDSFEDTIKEGVDDVMKRVHKFMKGKQ